MIVGTADVEVLAKQAATIESFTEDAIQLDDVLCMQVTAEMRNQAREAVLPPSLHPTVPAALSLQVWCVGGSPWGAFDMAVTRVACRSGVRARGFTTAVVASSAVVCRGLRGIFGFPARIGEVSLRHGYDGVSAWVVDGGEPILRINAIDPEPMSNDDVQYTSTVNLAHTPQGLRLVQLECDHAITRVERLRASIESFVGKAWGNALLDPYRVVSASVTRSTAVYPPIRFVCKADELAFTGTERVGVSR